MNKEEFCKRTGQKYEEVNEDDWNLIQTVYNYHPLISDVKGKDELCSLFLQGGFGLMQDMFGTANEIMVREGNVQSAMVEKEKIQKQFDADLKVLNAKFTEDMYLQNESIRMNTGQIENITDKYFNGER